MSETRRQREARGRRAEWVAAWWLRIKGYSIIAKRVRLKVGEIDLIAKRGSLLVFVEVKARPTLKRALEAVPESAWRRIAKASQIWAAKQSAYSEFDRRFDFVAVTRLWRPRHFVDFWRPDSD